MWDRFRSATGGGGGGGGGGGTAVDQVPGRTNTTTPLGRKDRAFMFTNMSSSSSSSSSSNNNSNGNSTPSWQPRSSVIAAREGQQQHQGPRQTKAGPPPPRPPRDFQLHQISSSSSFEPSTQQQRPYNLAPSNLTSTSHRDSIQGRPSSSVYSQPSPLVTDFGPRAPAYRYSAMSLEEEVSPPSSPEDFHRARGIVPNLDISPIDEEDGDYSPAHPRPLPEPPLKMSPSSAAPASQQQQSRLDDAGTISKAGAGAGTRSSIPMMRRERRAQRDAAAAGGRTTVVSDKPRGQKDPRWDPMTGEITTSDKGRPSQVKPVDFARGLGISTMSSKPLPGPSSPLDMERERALSRSGSRSGQRGAGRATDPAATAFGVSSGQQRPEWKGASGRTAIVDPVRDTPEVAPLKIPPRSRRREAGWTSTKDEQQQQQQQQQQASASENIFPDGGGGHDGTEIDNNAMARFSPPISPETRPENKGVGMEGGVVIGGGGSAGSHADATAAAADAASTTNKRNTNLKNLQPKGGARRGVEGEGGGGLNSTSTGRSFANTIRKIIPSSTSSTSRLFSGGSSSSRNSRAPTPDDSNNNSPNSNPLISQPKYSASTSAQHGYPSPPLSGKAVVEGGGSSLPVYAHLDAAPTNASNFGNANNAKIDSDSNGPTSSEFKAQQEPLHNDFQPPLPPLPPQSIRRKEVGSSITTASGLTSSSPANKHLTHESFSSSVYSYPDESQDDHPLQPPDFPNPNHPTTTTTTTAADLNTKSLPSLPPQDAAAKNSDPSYVQPSSRFSITTYATSAHTSSPRASLDRAPPLPTAPKDIILGSNNTQKSQNASSSPDSSSNQHTTPDMPASSVLDRQRPQMRGGNNKWEDPTSTNTDEPPIKISLSKAWMTKPGANSSGKSQQNSPPRTRQPKGPRELVPTSNTSTSTTSAMGNGHKENRGMFGFGFLGGGGSGNNGPKSPASDDSSRPASLLSNMDKDLPPAPIPASTLNSNSSTTATPTPTSSTADRIAQLNALLQDLANRRLNINRAIKQMTELMPQDNLIMPEAVRRKREDEKRKVEELRRRLDDVQREEHELGMKLHRAYKKLDRAAEYEPTTLWVRRATGS